MESLPVCLHPAKPVQGLAVHGTWHYTLPQGTSLKRIKPYYVGRPPPTPQKTLYELARMGEAVGFRWEFSRRELLIL